MVHSQYLNPEQHLEKDVRLWLVLLHSTIGLPITQIQRNYNSCIRPRYKELKRDRSESILNIYISAYILCKTRQLSTNDASQRCPAFIVRKEEINNNNNELYLQDI